MKKLMIGILLLIPIIIVLTLSAVTAIVTMTAFIGVEKISLDKDFVEIGFCDDIYNLDDYLIVTVLPERATDRQHVWSIAEEEIKCFDSGYATEWKDYKAAVAENPDYDGEVIPAPVELIDDNGNVVLENTTGSFRINAYCSFNVIVQAETKTAACTFYVKGETPQKLEISLPAEMQVGDSTLVDTVCTPIDATVSRYEWVSSDESILSVSEGAAEAHSVGAVSISLRAYINNTDYVESNTVNVTVNAAVSAFGSGIVSHSNLVGLAEIGLSSSSIIGTSNCTIIGDEISVIEPTASAYVTTDAGTLTIDICGENDIVIKNASLYAFSESNSKNFVLAIGDTLTLSAIWKSNLKTTSPTGVIWSSSTSSATVENGVVTGKGSGVTTITATYEVEGVEYSDSFLLNVQRKLNVLLIDKTNSELAVGIARETVLADTRFTSDELADLTRENNTFDVNVMFPIIADEDKEAFYGALLFSVEEDGEPSDKAYFEPNSNVMIFDSEKITEKTLLTVTVKAKYPRYSLLEEYTTCTFNVCVIDGVEVDDYNSMLRASEQRLNISLVDDVKLVYNEKYNNYENIMMFLYSDLYGNNHMIYSTSDQYKTYYSDGRGWQRKSHMALLYVPANCSPTISNVTLRACEVGEEISTGDDEMTSLMGRALHVHSERIPLGEGNSLTIHANIEFSIIENCRIAIDVDSAEVKVEGSIIRNTLEFGLRCISNTAGNNLSVRYGYITLKNMLFSNTCGTAFSIGNENFQSRPSFEQAYAEGKTNKLWQIGFIDIYNWQEINVLSMIPTEDLGAFGSSVNSKLRDIITTSDACKPYRVDHNAVTYFHFAGLSSGLEEPTVLQVMQMDDDRLHMFTTDDLASEGNNLFSMLNLKTVKIWGYQNTEQTIRPGKTYKVNAKLIDKLHGIEV